MADLSKAASRRDALGAAAGLCAGALALAGCSPDGGGGEVSATEDLMREHGVLRRILVIYRETGDWLAEGRTDFDVAALAQAAELFRTFGEEYHERALEEQHVFPVLRKAGGAGAALAPTLIAQHERGRQINAFIRARTAAGRIGAAEAAPLARALQSFARMYEAHTAFEDTVAFQAWRETLSPRQLESAGDEFEKLERRFFHGDGFDMAVDQVRAIEARLGLGDLGRYTPPAPTL
jgi:hemerythrin-like domain-containing protein